MILPDKSFYGVGATAVGIRATPALYRFNALGELLWKKKYVLEEVSYTYMRDIQATDDGGLILAGFQYRPDPQKSWILKVDSLGNTCSYVDCDSTILLTDTPEFTQNNIHFSITPNPASHQVEITYQIPKDGILKVYDYQGRLMDNWELRMNNSSLTLKVEGWSSGVYLYQLEVEGEKLESGKLIVE